MKENKKCSTPTPMDVDGMFKHRGMSVSNDWSEGWFGDGGGECWFEGGGEMEVNALGKRSRIVFQVRG